MAEALARVVAPHFVAGVVLQDGVVIYAAPILRWSVRMAWWQLRDYSRSKGWHASVVIDGR